MDTAIEHVAESVALDVASESLYRVPAVPTPATWAAFAHLKLRRRLSPHARVSRSEESFLSALENLSVHPAFRAAAEREIINTEIAFRGVEIVGLEAELASITPADWGLTAAEQKAALVVGGMKPAAAGPGLPVFDYARERAALELQTGTLALNGFLGDVRRAAELREKIAAAKAELKNLTTTAEREAVVRAERVKQAKAERAALRKRVPQEV